MSLFGAGAGGGTGGGFGGFGANNNNNQPGNNPSVFGGGGGFGQPANTGMSFLSLFFFFCLEAPRSTRHGPFRYAMIYLAMMRMMVLRD